GHEHVFCSLSMGALAAPERQAPASARSLPSEVAARQSVAYMPTASAAIAAASVVATAFQFDSGAARVAMTVAVLVILGALVAAIFARIGLRAYAEAANRERELRRQAELARAEAQRFAV